MQLSHTDATYLPAFPSHDNILHWRSWVHHGGAVGAENAPEEVLKHVVMDGVESGGEVLDGEFWGTVAAVQVVTATSGTAYAGGGGLKRDGGRRLGEREYWGNWPW